MGENKQYVRYQKTYDDINESEIQNLRRILMGDLKTVDEIPNYKIKVRIRVERKENQ